LNACCKPSRSHSLYRSSKPAVCLLLQVTPLHTDPYHNLLAQVVGRKHVRLYPPQATPRLYPFESGFTTNCSQVQLQGGDNTGHTKQPCFLHHDGQVATSSRSQVA
jgi:Cupin-like domain